MDEQSEVVIRDPHGTEHIFPAGFDPQKAAGIVRAQFVDARPISADEPDTFMGGAMKSLRAEVPRAVSRVAHGALDALPGIGAVVGGVLSTPETGGIGTIPGIALGAGAGRGVRDVIAAGLGMEKPSTAVGEGAKIAGETALAGLGAGVMPGAIAAAKTPLQTLREGAEYFGDVMPPAVRRLGGLFKSTPKPAAPLLERPAWQTWGEPTATPATRPATPPARPPVAATPSTPASALFTSNGDRLPPELAAKITGRLQMESPMQQPRVQVGAEVVGRQNGLTKEAVRQQTAPILGEQPGEASPIFPQRPFERMHDTLKALPKDGPERAAYVQRAGDPKTMGQLQTILRTLQRNGLALGGMTSAEAVRQAVMRKLRGVRGDN